MPRKTVVRRVVAAAAVATLLPVATEFRVARADRRLTDRWQRVPVAPRGATKLGISFRPRQAEELGLSPETTLRTLLTYPFQVIRLATYWDRIEPTPGAFHPDELDRQIEAAEHAGKQIILALGAVKNFGYPEYFVPPHRLTDPLPERTRIEPADFPSLLRSATGFLTRLVERYRDRTSIIAWQVEHEAVDPLGMEHSWRLAKAFVRAEVNAVRRADPSRPVLLNGFLPTSSPVRLQQWWRSRDQGDSLDVAADLADIVGIDFYPRHALVNVGGRTLYLDGSRRPWLQGRRRRLVQRIAWHGKRLMVSEGQAEPWEAVTTPPSPQDRGMFSCLPEQLIENYNRCLRWPAPKPEAYLFWGVEYWLLREQQGDRRYIQAFTRILNESARDNQTPTPR